MRLPQLRGHAQVVGARRAATSWSPRIFTQSSVMSTSAVCCALMRRPSGERQMRSVTKAISRPFQANSHGHEPLSRWVAATVVSGRRVELRLDDAVRPDDAHDLGARGLAEAEVDDGRVDRPLLQVQAGAQLHLAADAERVDALVAGGRGRARAQRLPAVGLRAAARRARTARPSSATPSDLEPAVAVEVGGGARAERERRRAAASKASCRRRAARARWPARPRRGRRRRCCRGPRRAARAPAAIPAGNASSRAIVRAPSGRRPAPARRGRRCRRPRRRSRRRAASPVVSADRQRHEPRHAGRQGLLAEDAAADVQRRVHRAVGVEQRRVRARRRRRGRPRRSRAGGRRPRTAAAPRTCRRRCSGARPARLPPAPGPRRGRPRCPRPPPRRRTPARAGAPGGASSRRTRR